MSDSPLRIFICHSSADKPSVRALHRRLTADGFAPWLDELDLLPGQNWEREIQKAIRASDIVLVCLSRDSITRRGYVQKEIGLVLDEADHIPDDTLFVIPARLEECAVPQRLSRWHWVDLFSDEGYQRLQRALDSIGGAPRTPRSPERVINETSDAPPHQRVGATGEVRFGGVYAQTGAESTSIIRFFTPNIAVSVSIGSDQPLEILLPKIVGWLRPGRDYGEGSFTVSGDAIGWDSISSVGTVRYRGTLGMGGVDLSLHTHSLINGHESYGVWRFAPLPRTDAE